MKNIGLFVGSLRRASYNKKIAQYLCRIAPEGFKYSIISIEDLPLYNQDFDDDGDVPKSYQDFRAQIAKLDGFIFITPEYNRSVPAVLKNALDVGSRPYGKNGWNGKPGAVISSTPGNLGAFGANHHLRQSLVFLNVLIMQQPEAYISNMKDIFDDEGNPSSTSSTDFFKQFVKAFAEWVNQVT